MCNSSHVDADLQSKDAGLCARLSMTVDSGLPWTDVDGHAEACSVFKHIKVIDLNHHTVLVCRVALKVALRCIVLNLQAHSILSI